MRVSNQEKGLDRARPFPPWTTVWTIDRAIDSILPMLTCQSYVSHNTKMARLKMLACGYAAMEIELELLKSGNLPEYYSCAKQYVIADTLLRRLQGTGLSLGKPCLL